MDALPGTVVLERQVRHCKFAMLRRWALVTGLPKRPDPGRPIRQTRPYSR